MIFDNRLKHKLLVSEILFILFLIFTFIALIGPKWGIGYAPMEYRKGLDVVFAIDISRSMDIRDVQTVSQTRARTGFQSRLERGISIARESVISVSGARFAAAIGRGRGYLAVPLTYDSEAALIFLESLDVTSMTGRSTNLESLVDAAVEAFQDSSPARKVIVLVSDGEAHAGILRNAVNRCVRDGIILNTVAVGSDEGRQITAQVNNPDSSSVISRRDAFVMRAAAERTGGIYIDGGREDSGAALSSQLLSLAQEMGSGNRKQEPKQRRPLFIILAIISYGASKFVTRQSQRKPLRRLSAASIITLLLFTSCSEGKLLLLQANYLNAMGRYDEALVPYLKALNHEDSAPYAEYGLGLTFYQLDEGKAALKRYDDSHKLLEKYSSNEHRELRYRNHYNSGVIFFEEGDYHSAAESFKEALRTDPKRLDAKRNLELSLMSISMETNTGSNAKNREESREILFEYLKQDEQQKWKSREWEPEEDFTGPDY
ncbi:tetratricopeptide repeat domain protein [Treponema sp. R8-4-B8]